MQISQASQKCGLSVHTIRYYEKSGMLPEIARSDDGNRSFTTKHIDWLTLLFYLRETGMPMKTMKRFTMLAQSADDTFTQRREILLSHKEALKQQRENLDRCEAALDHKINVYYPKIEQEQ